MLDELAVVFAEIHADWGQGSSELFVQPRFNFVFLHRCLESDPEEQID